jgi:hypothetical protein
MSLVGLKIALSNLANTVSARYTHLMIPTHIDVLIFFGRDMARSLPWLAGFQRLVPTSAIMQLCVQVTTTFGRGTANGTCFHTSLLGVLRCSAARPVASSRERLLFVCPGIAATEGCRPPYRKAPQPENPSGKYSGEVIADLLSPENSGSCQGFISLRYVVQ